MHIFCLFGVFLHVSCSTLAAQGLRPVNSLLKGELGTGAVAAKPPWGGKSWLLNKSQSCRQGRGITELFVWQYRHRSAPEVLGLLQHSQSQLCPCDYTATGGAKMATGPSRRVSAHRCCPWVHWLCSSTATLGVGTGTCFSLTSCLLLALR